MRYREFWLWTDFVKSVNQ